LLAKGVNDNAGYLVERDTLAFFASKLAPTTGAKPVISRGLFYA